MEIEGADRGDVNVAGEAAGPRLQRKEDGGGGGPPPPQRSAGGEDRGAPPDVEDFVSSTRGGGDRLQDGVLQKMNSAFGQDFGGVGIHTDAAAADACRTMGAQAFTVGSDVYFDSGKYDPGSSSGQELIGHELTHVVQQQGGQAHGAQAKLAVGGTGDAHEQEADKMGAKAAAGPDGAAPDDPTKPKKAFKKQDANGAEVSADASTLRMTPAPVGFGDRDYSIVGKVPGVIQSHIAQDVDVSGDTNWKSIWSSRWILYDANDAVVHQSSHWKHPDYTLTQANIKKGVPSDGGSNEWTIRFEAMETGVPFGGSDPSNFPWDQSRFHVYASPIANPHFTATAERGNQIAASDSFTPAEDGASYSMALSGTSTRADSGSETVTTSVKVSGERETSLGFEIEGVSGGLKDKVGFEAQKSIAKSTGYTVTNSTTQTRTFTQSGLKKGKQYNFTAYPKFMVLTGSANILSQNMGIVTDKVATAGSIRIWTGYEFVAE
jgi:hypothetical protein